MGLWEGRDWVTVDGRWMVDRKRDRKRDTFTYQLSAKGGRRGGRVQRS